MVETPKEAPRMSRSCPWLLVVVACSGSSEPAKSGPRPEDVPSLALLEGGVERPVDSTATGDGESCERIIDAERRKAESMGSPGEEPPPEQTEEIKTILNAGEYLNTCSVAASAAVDVCAAIIGGRAVGVTVKIVPGTEDQAACVANTIRRMSFPDHALVSVARTEFHRD